MKLHGREKRKKGGMEGGEKVERKLCLFCFVFIRNIAMIKYFIRTNFRKQGFMGMESVVATDSIMQRSIQLLLAHILADLKKK